MKEVGNQLRTIREGKGLSLEDVESATKIRSYYIDAIENGNLDVLPGPVYAVGFAKSYGKFLGLNEDEVGAVYKSYFNQISIDKPARPSQRAAKGGKAVSPTEKAVINNAVGGSSNAKRISQQNINFNGGNRPIRTRKSSFGSRFIWLILILVILVAGIILYTVFFSDNNNEVDPTDPATVNNTAGLSTNVDGVNLVITATGAEPCWISVNVDGTEFQDTVKADEPKTYEGANSIVVSYGNADSVTVTCNGVDLGTVSTEHEVMTVEYGQTGIISETPSISDVVNNPDAGTPIDNTGGTDTTDGTAPTDDTTDNTDTPPAE